MDRVKISLMVGTALVGVTCAATTARAADPPVYSQPQPQIIYQPQPIAPPPLPQIQEFEGWYLRGDIGYAMLRATEIEYIKNPGNPPNNFAFEHFTLSDQFFFGLGVGYQFNSMFRLDVTGEYRFKSSVFAIGSYTDGGFNLDIYNGHFKSWVFLANAYMDFGTWWCITPFIGVGIGGAYNTLSLSDFGVPNAGRGFSSDKSELDFAYALHAGLSYSVTQNFKVELAYRYLNMGSSSTSILCAGGCLPDSYKLKDLSASEFKLALRWSLYEAQESYYAPPPPPPVYQPPPQVYVQQPAPVYAPPPPPQPVYAPQPQYQPPPPVYQPPLRRKG